MDKNSYALGMSITRTMMRSGLQLEFDDFVAGVKAILTGSQPEMSFEEAYLLLDKYLAELEAGQEAQSETMSATMKEEDEANDEFELPARQGYPPAVRKVGVK